MHSIKIENANEGNLKNVSLEIPKNKLVVFTGVSGSGKSTLLIDVLFNECQRQYLEALSLQGIHKPKVDRIRGVSPAIVISQTDTNKNPRSTVGTVSNIYTDLRMIYEKLGTRTCPHCGKIIMAADCKEETEKIGNDFYVYMYCCECGKRMEKITRTHFSFNTKEGACPVCEGLGKIHTIRRAQAVNEQLSLEDGAVTYWEKKYGEYQISVLYAAFKHYGIPVPANSPVQQFSEMQKAIFYDGIDCELVKKAFPDLTPPKTAALGKYEGALPILWRRFTEKNGDVKQFAPYFTTIECPQCKGERLAESGRIVTVNGVRLPQLSLFSLEELFQWIQELGDVVTGQQESFVAAYLLDIRTKLSRFINVGLGYLSLDRQTVTLSGGELQRLRLAAVLDSDLS
ncbi:ATP-binding cassette domain-containing protein, partial [Robinsoniella sp.]